MVQRHHYLPDFEPSHHIVYFLIFYAFVYSSNIDVKEPVQYPKEKATEYTIQDIVNLLPENERLNQTQMRETGAIIHGIPFFLT